MSNELIDAAWAPNDAFNRGDWSAFEAGLDPDAVYEEVTTGRRTDGAKANTELAKGWKSAFPDAQGTMDASYVSGDTVIFELTWRGTQNGPLPLPERQRIATDRKADRDEGRHGNDHEKRQDRAPAALSRHACHADSTGRHPLVIPRPAEPGGTNRRQGKICPAVGRDRIRRVSRRYRSRSLRPCCASPPRCRRYTRPSLRKSWKPCRRRLRRWLPAPPRLPSGRGPD